jgi:hypothetical protein
MERFETKTIGRWLKMKHEQPARVILEINMRKYRIKHFFAD